MTSHSLWTAEGCFAQQYNRRHKRYGALWSERVKSVLLEGGAAVAAIAAYIDLNPVRAGLCEDPKGTDTAIMRKRLPRAPRQPLRG